MWLFTTEEQAIDYLYRQAKTFITKQTTAEVKIASSLVGGTIRLNVKPVMKTNNAVISAFVFAWIVPPYSWLVYEFLNPTSPGSLGSWKYYFDSNVTAELSYILISIVAFLISSIVATSAGLLVTKLRSFSIRFTLPNYVADIVLAFSIFGMLYGVLSYFTIFVSLFLLFTRSYREPLLGFFGLVLVILFQIQGYFTYKFCIALLCGIVFFELFTRFRRIAIASAIVGTTLASMHLGHRFYPSLTWLFEGTANFEIFLYDIIPGVNPRPSLSHYFVCEIYSTGCFDYMAAVEVFLPVMFPFEYRLPLSILWTVLISLILMAFLPKTIGSARITLLCFGWFGLLYGNLTLCVAAFLVSILRSDERNSL